MDIQVTEVSREAAAAVPAVLTRTRLGADLSQLGGQPEPLSGGWPAGCPGKASYEQAVKLLVADPQPVVLAGIAHVIERCPWLALVATARTGREAIGVAQRIQPDMVIIDVRLPDMRTVEVLRGMRTWTPRIKVLIFTAESNRAAISALTAEGVDAIVHRYIDPAELLEIIGRVSLGERPAQSRHSDPGPWPGPIRSLLTRREHEILSQVALGKTNSEIAQELGLAHSTVKTYFQRTLEKLNARNRVEAVNRAAEMGLL